MLETHRHQLQALLGNRSTEQACFLLCHEARSDDGIVLIVREIVELFELDFIRKEHDIISVSADTMLKIARKASCLRTSICMVHTHPLSDDDVCFSEADDLGNSNSFRFFHQIVPGVSHSSVVFSGTFAAFDGRIYRSDGSWMEIDRIVFSDGRSANAMDRLSRSPAAHAHRVAENDRQVRLLGPAGQDRISGARIAFVGCGGLGALTTVLMGHANVGQLELIDADVVTVESRPRIPGATDNDVLHKASKVEVLRRYLETCAPNVKVRTHPSSVEREELKSMLVGCDLIICATDTTASRAYLNQLCHQYFVPIIDLGLQFKVDTVSHKVSHEVGKVNLMAPSSPCLLCIGHLPGDQLRIESLSPAQRVAEERQGYIIGGDEPEPSMMIFNAGVAARGAQIAIMWLSGSGSVDRNTYEQFSPFGVNNRPLVSRVRKRHGSDCPFCSESSRYLAKGNSLAMLTIHVETKVA